MEIIRINDENFTETSLDDFELCQQVTACWRKVDATYRRMPVRYTDDWDISERRNMARKIMAAVRGGATALAATEGKTVVGFALLAKERLGSEKQYLDLVEFYVTRSYRRRGVGKILFEKICREAKQAGAKKLYISAHSAEESIAAYTKYGCVFAEEHDAAHSKKEPFDIPLEYDLSVRIYEVSAKEDYKDLLLLGDEQIEMVERYLHHSTMYVLNDCGVQGEITVTDAGGGVLEIKNLAVRPAYRRRGYGKKLVDFVCNAYKGKYAVVQVGTGDSPLTIPFYKKCGFTPAYTVKDFFLQHYDHPIIEAGTQLKDMVYLVKNI